TALDLVRRHCLKVAEDLAAQLPEHAAKTAAARKDVDAALQDCLTAVTGFRFFGGRSKTRQLRHFMDTLTLYARQRLAEEVHFAVKNCYASLAGRLADRSRDLGFCRQRLRSLMENLDCNPADENEDLTGTRPASEHTLTRSPLPTPDAFWEVIRDSATARVILPDNEDDLERAALRFLQNLSAEHWLQLDKELNDRVLVPRGGLQSACINSGDLTRQLALPLLQETSNLLGQHLPIMDVAQILGAEWQVNNQGGDPDKLREQTEEYLQRAAPLLAGKINQQQHTFLLAPASPAGRDVANAVAATFPNIHHVRVPGQADLMFLVEQGPIAQADVQKFLKPCRAAYDSLVGAPNVSPHARFDIVDWSPLDP
ncbi:MAG: hypothetical protein NZO58_04440, partial [Gemmataceae bacterium]|nr:hypothetical protein [Gemmataceae bacterium]